MMVALYVILLLWLFVTHKAVQLRMLHYIFNEECKDEKTKAKFESSTGCLDVSFMCKIFYCFSNKSSAL